MVTGRVPWFPHGLRKYAERAADLRRSWCYVVLEEVVDGTALLLRWPWPLADELGRLYWPADDDGKVLEASIPVSVLEDELYQPNRLLRSPRTGDTFAAKRSGRGLWGEADEVVRVRDLFPDHAIDVSADARAAAKLAYQGSLVTAMPKRLVEPEVVRQSAAERRRLQAHKLVTGRGPDDRGPRNGDRR